MTAPSTRNRNRDGLAPDPFWYKSGVIYEVHVRAFCDSDGDGTGDFQGLTGKLDYIKELGVTAIWLLPFYPSPLRDDGYDIADYHDVHPMYGTLADFRVFLREAHRRGLRVITELVLNHTSDQHPWFQRSRRAKPGSRWRNFYVWSDDPHKYRDTYIIFKDVEPSNWTWDPVAKAYFWHRFFSHQPDLNYDNPEVHETMFEVMDFWLDLGVDGLRLDAVPYLYEREGTACENLPETHAFLRRLRAHVDRKYGDRMLLAEANQWPEDAVTYFGRGRGDECHMAFHFPLMPRLFMAVRMEDSLPITDILEQTPAIPQTSQWALFLRNHDELTLSMVTDEERDYMYRMYAQVHQARLNLGIRRRLAPLLGNDGNSIQLLNALLFSLPGTPVLYYGDEIGMGENIFLGDRNGVRTPMQWSPDKNAGFSRANPQSLYLPIILDSGYHYEAVNVEVQLANPHSLLWWMRRMLALRQRWRAFGEGKCEFLKPDNRKILSYVLRHQDETLLVVANLSRFTQPVELDLASFQPRVPIELFGRAKFPAITDKPYSLSLGPHGFYWFSLEPPPGSIPARSATGTAARLPTLAAREWRDLSTAGNKPAVETALTRYLERQRWFAGQGRSVKSVTLMDFIPVSLPDHSDSGVGLVQVDYVEGDTEVYALPLAFAAGVEAQRLRREFPQRMVALTALPEHRRSGILYDALAGPLFGPALLELFQNRRRLKNGRGEIEATGTPALRRLLGRTPPPEPIPFRVEQGHSSLLYGDKVLMKFFRRLHPGQNPALELGRFLTGKNFPHILPHVGALEYTVADSRMTLAVVNAFIPGAKNAWDFTLDALGRYYDRVTSWVAQGRAAPATGTEPVHLRSPDLPAAIAESIGTYLEAARMLGVRTAELHLALASDSADEHLAPEMYTSHYQRSLFQSLRNLTRETLRRLGKRADALPAEVAALARRAIEAEPALIHRARQFLTRRLGAKRIRIHGNCQLGQLLWTGRDFVFLDLEGDASVATSERSIKRSPLRDVAGMIRSFRYAASAGLHQHVDRGSIAHNNLPAFASWVGCWNHGVTVAFLKAYLRAVAKAELLPDNHADLHALLQTCLLNQLLVELERERNAAADRLQIPLQGITDWIDEAATRPATVDSGK